MRYCLQEIVDFDERLLYFTSKVDLMCHIDHHQTFHRSSPTFIQSNNHSSGTSVSVLGGRNSGSSSWSEAASKWAASKFPPTQIDQAAPVQSPSSSFHFYWKETNPGADRFYRKLSDRAFNQVLLHEINKCTWDPSLKAVTLPRAQTEMAAIADFNQQDWVKQLTQEENPRQTTKKLVDPKMAFPFQDNFSVGTIHGANAKAAIPSTLDIVEIQDNEQDINILTTKTASGAQSEVVVGSRVAFGSNPISDPTTNSTPPGAAGDGLDDPFSASPGGRAKGGPISI
jgi:hypothetical protein